MPNDRAPLPSHEEAEAIAVQALLFLTADAGRLGRFLAETGLAPAELRRAAGETSTLVAVLDHLLGDESLLMVFAAGAGVDASAIGSARMALGGDGGPPASVRAGKPRRPSKRWPGI